MNSDGLSNDVGVRGFHLENLNCDPRLWVKVDGEKLKMMVQVCEWGH